MSNKDIAKRLIEKSGDIDFVFNVYATQSRIKAFSNLQKNIALILNTKDEQIKAYEEALEWLSTREEDCVTIDYLQQRARDVLAKFKK